MQLATRKWRTFLTVLLAGVVLRAFIPAGYMPAAPGKGLLFELCHDGLPAGFMEALGGHGHHASHGGHQASHGGHDDHASGGDCSIGHILSLAFIDEAETAQPAIQSPLGILIAAPMQRLLRGQAGVYSARAPPIP
jgi:hypothetical protein